MPVGEAHIHVECDKCDFVSDPYSLTMLAGGGWDARNLKTKLRNEGWKINDATNETICPECAEG